jgi:hypothetical protein
VLVCGPMCSFVDPIRCFVVESQAYTTSIDFAGCAVQFVRGLENAPTGDLHNIIVVTAILNKRSNGTLVIPTIPR